MDKNWKRFERDWGKLIHGVRHPCIGRGHIDVESRYWACECKYRKKLPDWLSYAMTQAQKACGDKLPIVPIKEGGKQDCIILMPGSVFLFLAEKAGLLPEEEKEDE